MSGKLVVYCGCMFSGKSERLINKINSYDAIDKEFRVFRPGVDDRHGDRFIGSHSGMKWPADILENDDEEIIFEYIDDVDAVFIDDANLLSDKLIKIVQRLINENIDVFIAATDKDFRGYPFEPVNDLLSLADDVFKLSAFCSECGSKATMTQRLINGEPASSDDPLILVDSKDSYEPRCRDCHIIRD